MPLWCIVVWNCILLVTIHCGTYLLKNLTKYGARVRVCVRACVVERHSSVVLECCNGVKTSGTLLVVGSSPVMGALA